MAREAGKVDGARSSMDGAAAGQPIKVSDVGSQWTVRASAGYSRVGNDGPQFAGVGAIGAVGGGGDSSESGGAKGARRGGGPTPSG